MFSIDLSDDQEKQIALNWILKQQDEYDGYKLVMRTLLENAFMAKWDWSDALSYAVNLCSKEYHVEKTTVKEYL